MEDYRLGIALGDRVRSVFEPVALVLLRDDSEHKNSVLGEVHVGLLAARDLPLRIQHHLQVLLLDEVLGKLQVVEHSVASESTPFKTNARALAVESRAGAIRIERVSYDYQRLSIREL